MNAMRIAAVAATVAISGSSAMAQSGPSFWSHEWPDTDFSQTSVDFIEILSGGPPKDGIPAVDDPQFVTVSDVEGIGAREPVVTVEIEGARPRTYPIRYLTWHEIVNDRIDGVPVTVTFCPLCNSAIVFDGRTEMGELTFGVSGKLRNSDMIMYDRQTESWWQQFTGEAIVGKLLGASLTTLPSWMESYAEYTARNPDGLVMAQPPALRPYGTNPYEGYDGSYRPFLYSGEMPPHDIEPLSRVVRVGDTAWPLTRLSEAGEIVEDGVRITWVSGQASALDSRDISKGRDVGTIRVFDAETGAPVAHEVVFAFAFHAFSPEGTWRLGS